MWLCGPWINDKLWVHKRGVVESYECMGTVALTHRCQLLTNRKIITITRCDGVCDGWRLSWGLSQTEGVMEVKSFEKDSFKECPLTVPTSINESLPDIMLRFCNSYQLRLHLRLSCEYLSTNSILRCMTVGYHIIFVPLFTRTFLQDSPSYSQVLPYVTTIWSSSVDINSDSLLYIPTLDFVFQGTGMHRTIFTIYHMFIPCLRNSL